MRDEGLHHRGEQKRLHIHVEQTGDAADGVVGVQRAEDKVAGHRGADGDIRGLDIANLADHYHIRILSQNVAQAFSESEIDFRFHVDLRDTGESDIRPVLRS